MIKRRKKQPPVTRNPHIDRLKQPAFRYSSNRAQSERTVRENSSEQQADYDFARSARKGVYALSAILAILLAVFLSLLTQQPKLNIKGDQTALRDSYQQAASDITGDQIINKSKLTMNRKKISDEMQARYPELQSVDVVTPLFSRSATLNVQLYKPALVLVSGSSQFVLNDRGKALLDASKQPNGVDVASYLRLNDSSNTKIESGNQALTSVQVAYILEIKRQSEAKDLPVSSMELGAGGGELSVKHGDLPYSVKYNIYENARKSFGTFIAAREQADKTKVKPAEYIDVRVPERAYIK